MSSYEHLSAIFDRIANGEETAEDIQTMRSLLRSRDGQNVVQVGNNIVNIADGRDFQIGKRIYQGADAEAIKKALREVLQEKQKAERSAFEKQFLEWVEDDVIKERLKELPNNVERINLDKEWQQKRVKHPNRVDLSGRDQEEIKDGSIFEIFKKAQTLLILGEPGAGKTTTMLLLAEALINEAKQQGNSPIPVYLKLSSWEKGKKPMFDWLVEALSKKQYRYALKKKYVENLLTSNRLLLMLDDLDELEEDCRINCAEAINRLLTNGKDFPEEEASCSEEEASCSWSPRQLVVCSRRQEYETLGFNLELKGAIYLKALSDTQIQEYLADRNREEFLQTLQYQDRQKLRDVLGRPLFLRIVCDAMQKISIDELNKLNSLEDRQLYLFTSYIIWCLREKNGWEQTENIRLLIWLAQQLKEHSQTEFFIESMQPSWLPDGTKKLYFLLVGLSIILILSPPYITCVFIKALDIFWLPWLMIGILIIAVLASFSSKIIKPFEEDIITTIGYSLNLRFFWIRKLKRRRRISLTIAATLFAAGIILVSILRSIPSNWVKIVCLILLFSCLLWGFARIKARELQQKTLRNQGIRTSAINAASVAVFIPIVVAIGFSITLPANLFFSQFLSSLLMIGLPLGLTCALFCGGLACIQHFILRLILLCHEHPWNYVEFLDNAVKLKLLRRVGGRYEFMHSLLKECFAILENII